MSDRFEPIPDEVESVAAIVVDSALAVHKALGPGLLEHVYEVCLAHELSKRGLGVKRQIELPVIYDGIRFEGAYKLDLIVEECVIVEVKSVESLLPTHQAQLLTYLKLANVRLGLLINFDTVLLKDGIRRKVL